MASRRLGRYEVFEEIGAGGMGRVLRGRDPELRRPVAIKALSERLRGKAGIAERFRREALALARLSHPNIVRVFDVGEEQGLLFYVMELLEGTGLGQRTQHPDSSGAFAAGPVFDPEEFLATFIPLAGALEVVHAAGLVHRDLKPSNILEGVPGRGAVLIDFGIARLEGQDGLTADGLVMGTAQYIAPEQVSGQPADAVSDLFSLGATMWEFATGRLPFGSIPSSSLLAARAFVELPPVGKIVSGVPQSIAMVIDRCCQFHREKRYGSTGELRLALEAAARGRTSTAPEQTGPRPRTTRPAKALAGGRAAPSPSAPLAGRFARTALLAGALLGLVGLVASFRPAPAPLPPLARPVSPQATGPAGQSADASRPTSAAVAGTVLNPGGPPTNTVGLALLGDRIAVFWPEAGVGLRAAVRVKDTWSIVATSQGPELAENSGLIVKAIDGRAILAYTGTGPAGGPVAQTVAFDPETNAWSTPISLGPAESPGIQLELAARPGGAGPALIVWEGPSRHELSAAWQLPGGKGWAPSHQLQCRNRRERFAVAQDAAGEGLVVWQQQVNESAAWQLLASRCGGPKGLWLTPTLLKFQAAGIDTIHPVLAATGSRFHLAWSEVEFLIHPMMTASSEDGGRTFGAPVRLCWPYGRDPFARLGAAGDQVWAIYWFAPAKLLAWAHSSDRGRTWARRRLLGPVGDGPNATALAVTPAGEAWLVWADDRGAVRVACLR